MIQDLKKEFPNDTIGYSDHTLPGEMDVLLYSVLFGAKILENILLLIKI